MKPKSPLLKKLSAFSFKPTKAEKKKTLEEQHKAANMSTKIEAVLNAKLGAFNLHRCGICGVPCERANAEARRAGLITEGSCGYC